MGVGGPRLNATSGGLGKQPAMYQYSSGHTVLMHEECVCGYSLVFVWPVYGACLASTHLLVIVQPLSVDTVDSKSLGFGALLAVSWAHKVMFPHVDEENC